jgi:hypothetical protein
LQYICGQYDNKEQSIPGTEEVMELDFLSCPADQWMLAFGASKEIEGIEVISVRIETLNQFLLRKLVYQWRILNTGQSN